LRADGSKKTVAANNRKLIESTLTAIFNEKYAGAMDDMSKTWEGMVSNLGDQWTRFKLMIMKAGVFDWMKDRLGLILETANRLAENGTLARYAMEIGQNLKAAGVAIWNFGERVYGIGKYLAGMVGGWENLGIILLALKLVPVAAGLVAITQAMIGMGVALTGLLIANPILAGIAVAIAAVAGLAYLVWKNWEPIKAWFAQSWQQMLTDVGIFLVKMGALWVDLFTPVGWAWAGFSALMNLIGVEMPLRFTEMGKNAIAGLIQGLKSAFPGVKSVMDGISNAMPEWMREKLGIHSPSRVFAELGSYTMQGLDQGIAGGQDGPLKAVAGVAKRLTAAGAVALGAGVALPAMAHMPALDSRPPLAAPVSSPGAGGQTFNFSLTINAAEGADANQLAASVRREMERFMREQAAGRRSALYDRY
jgi:hypothetical protein